MTTTISRGGIVCRRIDSTAATRSCQRSSVYAQITTETFRVVPVIVPPAFLVDIALPGPSCAGQVAMPKSGRAHTLLIQPGDHPCPAIRPTLLHSYPL